MSLSWHSRQKYRCPITSRKCHQVKMLMAQITRWWLQLPTDGSNYQLMAQITNLQYEEWMGNMLKIVSENCKERLSSISIIPWEFGDLATSWASLLPYNSTEQWHRQASGIHSTICLVSFACLFAAILLLCGWAAGPAHHLHFSSLTTCQNEHLGYYFSLDSNPCAGHHTWGKAMLADWLSFWIECGT